MAMDPSGAPSEWVAVWDRLQHATELVGKVYSEEGLFGASTLSLPSPRAQAAQVCRAQAVYDANEFAYEYARTTGHYLAKNEEMELWDQFSEYMHALHGVDTFSMEKKQELWSCVD